MTGTVEWFDNEKGYGFIRNNEHQVLFVHYSAIRNQHDEYRTLYEGERVRFERKHGARGLYARNVRVIH